MPKPLRLAHVNDIAWVGATLVGGLRAIGYRADLIDPPRPGARWRWPLRLLMAPVRIGALLAVVPRLWVGRYDIVHVHFAWKAVVGLLTRPPLVVHCHGSDVRNVPTHSIRGRVNARLLRRAAAVYYATPDLAAWVLPMRADARFLPNPIDTSVFRPTGANPERDILVGVRLDPGKGVDEVQRLLAVLIAARPSTTVTIVGLGSEVDAVRRAAGRLSIVIAAVRHDAMAGLLARHRIAIGQFRVGALGNYELEALAAGLPVAASYRFTEAYDEPPPLIAGGADVHALGEAIAQLLDDDDARAILGAAGRRWILTHHERDLITAELAATYEGLLVRP